MFDPRRFTLQIRPYRLYAMIASLKTTIPILLDGCRYVYDRIVKIGIYFRSIEIIINHKIIYVIP